MNKLAAHVEELTGRFKIKVKKLRAVRGASLVGYAEPEDKVILISPVRGEISYIVALHEIGHVVGEGNNRMELSREGAAWKWAVQNSIIPINARMRKKITDCAMGYYLDAEDWELPHKEHVFWNFVYGRF